MNYHLFPIISFSGDKIEVLLYPESEKLLFFVTLILTIYIIYKIIKL